MSKLEQRKEVSVYYILVAQFGHPSRWEKVKGYKVENDKIDLFAHHAFINGKFVSGRWAVSDVKTGRAILDTFPTTRRQAVINALAKVDKYSINDLDKLIDASIHMYGSPPKEAQDVQETSNVHLKRRPIRVDSRL